MENNNFTKIMEEYRNGSKEQAMTEAIGELENLIKNIIGKKYSTYAKNHHFDLMQSGYLGIIKALPNYDETISMPSTYFTPHIKHELQLYIDTYVDKTTTHYGSNIRRIKKVINEISETNPNYTTIDISDITGLSVEQVERALTIMRNRNNTISYESLIDPDCFVKDMSSIISPEDEYIKNEVSNEICEALELLEEDERTFTKLLFGIDEERPYTLREISQKMGLRIDSLKKIQARAYQKLRSSELNKSHYDFMRQKELSIGRSENLSMFNLKDDDLDIFSCITIAK